MRLGGVEECTLPGLRYPMRRLKNGFAVQPVHWSDNPDHDEAWADHESVKYGGRKSGGWRQNMEMDLLRGGRPVWPMLSEEYHVRTIPRDQYLSADWAVWRSLDRGMAHPYCCAWAAVHKNGDKYFFRQLYRTDTPIPILIKQTLDADGEDEACCGSVGDSDFWARDPKTMETYASTFAKNGLPMVMADKGKLGYDTLAEGFFSSVARWCLGHADRGGLSVIRDMMGAPTLTPGDVERIAQKPAIWFHPSVAGGAESLYKQCENLRYREHRNPLHTAEPSMPEDKEDEGPDVVRYMCHTPAVQWSMPRRAGTHDLIDDLLALSAASAKRGVDRWQ